MCLTNGKGQCEAMIRTISRMHLLLSHLRYFGTSMGKVIKQETRKEKRQEAKIVSCSRKGVTNKSSTHGRQQYTFDL